MREKGAIGVDLQRLEILQEVLESLMFISGNYWQETNVQRKGGINVICSNIVLSEFLCVK